VFRYRAETRASREKVMKMAGKPPVTPELRERAKQAPGTRIHAVDPAFEGTEDAPGWAIAGTYEVDEKGEIGDEFTPNPDYLPTAFALGFPVPANELEIALQNAATGHGGADDVRAALLEATVFTPRLPESHGQEAVHVFTSESYLPDTEPRRNYERVPARSLALSEGYVVLNPGSQLEMRLTGTDLVRSPL
jgi:hypothetical protein